MKKIISVLALTLALSMGSGIVANAATTVADLTTALQAVGISQTYIANITSYLQSVTITEAQSEQIFANINRVQLLVGNTTDLTTLPGEIKTELQALAIETGNILGLAVSFDKVNGQPVVVIKTANGAVLISLTAAEVAELLATNTIEQLKNAVITAIKFSNDSAKNEVFEPVDGELNNTATNYGNQMALGATFLVAGASVAVVSRKKVQA
ncbi:MAG: hypothetical protein ACRC17_05490 [Culicoidibacterales bacterium]